MATRKRGEAGDKGTAAILPRRGKKVSSDQIVESILSAVAEHRLPPGTKLGEEHLGEIFGVSRTVIRQALVRLANDRIITLEPNRGAFVAQPTVQEARDVFEARRVIESAVVARLVKAVEPAQLAELRRLIEREDEARAAGDRRALVKLSGEFHLLIAEMAGNGTLTAMLRELVLRSSLVIMLYEIGNRPACPPTEHRELVDAIAARDATAACRIMSEHLGHVEESLNLIDEEPALPDLRSVFVELAR